MVTPVAGFITRKGLQIESGGSITVDVAARCAIADHGLTGDGMDRVDFTFTDSQGNVVPVTGNAIALDRASEIAGETGPLAGLSAGQEAPVRVYSSGPVAMTALAAGVFRVDATVWPLSGTPRVLPTQFHYNNKDSSVTRSQVHLSPTGNDANDGHDSAHSMLTMGAALDRLRVLTGGNLGHGDVLVHGSAHWDATAGFVLSGADCGTADQWCNIIGVDGTPEIGLAVAGVRSLRVSPGDGKELRFCFQSLTQRGKLETLNDTGTIGVAWDNCAVKPHSQWDDASDPAVGAYDEGRHGIFWISNGEPSHSWFLGSTFQGMDLAFADKNTVIRGSKFFRGYGVLLQLAGGTTADAVESNVFVISCHVEDWRHSTGSAGAGVSPPKGYLAGSTSIFFEAVDNGSGKLRLRIQSGHSAATSFWKPCSDSAGSVTIGIHIDDVNVGGVSGTTGLLDGRTYSVLAAGLNDGSGREYVDLNVTSTGLTEAAGNTITIRTGRISDGLDWSAVIHSDVVKLNFPTFARNFIWADVYGKLNTTPRYFGLDSYLENVWLSCSTGLCGSVQNSDIGFTGGFYNHVLIENASMVGTVTIWPNAPNADCELRDSIFDSLSAGGGGTLDQLAANWAIRCCHFLVSSQARGLSPTTGNPYSSGTPGQSGDYRLTLGSTAAGSASGAGGRPPEWFSGDRGVLYPALQGSFDIPVGGGLTSYDLNPLDVTLDLANLAQRNLTHVQSLTAVRPIWPPGSVIPGNLTATACTSTVLTDAARSNATDAYRGYFIRVLGTGNIVNIKNNDATTYTACDGETFTAADIAALTTGTNRGYEVGPTGPAVGLQAVESGWQADNQFTNDTDDIPDRWDYPPTTPGSAEPEVDEVDWVSTRVGDPNSVLRAKVSRRAGMCTRVGVQLSGPGFNYNEPDIMLRGAWAGLGSSFGQAYDIDEFYDSPEVSRANPTHGGTNMRPDFGTASLRRRLITSPPVGGAAGVFVLSGSSDQARYICTVNPLDWAPDGEETVWGAKGGDNNTTFIYPRQMQTEAGKGFVGGRQFIHKLDHWFYDPDDYDSSRYGDLGQFSPGLGGLFACRRKFDEAYIIDPLTGATTLLDKTAWNNNNGDSWQVFANRSGIQSRYNPFGGSPVDMGQLISGDYLAFVMRRSSDDFSVGVMMKMGDYYGPKLAQRDIRQTVFTAQVFYAYTQDPTQPWDIDQIQTPSWYASSRYGVAPGYHAEQTYLFIGPFSQAIAAAREAQSSGLLDAPSDPSIFLDTPDVLTRTDLTTLFGSYELDPLLTTADLGEIVVGGGLPFNVEDGTGLADSNSYATVEAADAYFEVLGDPSAWVSATLDQKQSALRIATQFLDLEFATQWVGVPVSRTQALAHPQMGIQDLFGYPVTVPPLPLHLQQACCEAALRELQYPGSLFPSSTTVSSTGSSNLKLGNFTLSRSSGASSVVQTLIPKITRLLQTGGLIGGSWVTR